MGAPGRRKQIDLVGAQARFEAKALVRLSLGERPELPEISADGSEFWDAVRSLPRRQAQVVALFYLEDRPVADIAEYSRSRRAR